ncbi:unnamed protein product [marine sediment metagenome]|uniref:Uncharacterized protein n=1 Tax=marine sediment metagenome TaxID=412755 RepID=X1VC87_9ZZZZ
MLKKQAIGVLAAVMLATVLFSGCIQDEEIGVYPGSNEIDVDAAFISQFLDIPEYEINDAISDLNIKTYGINGVSKNIILAWYENRHQDWVLKKSEDTTIFSIRAWLSWFTGHVVVVSDLGSMQNLVGYDVVFLTSYAHLDVYDKYLNYL